MTATHFSGPVIAGTLTTGQTNGPNQGAVRLEQFATLTQNGANAVSSTLYIPAGSRITGFNIDVLTVFTNASTVTLTIGTSAADTTYASSVDVKTAAGRIAITFTAAQLAAMAGLTTAGAASPTTAPVVITVTPAGASSGAQTGVVTVTVSYVQQ